MQTHLKLLPAEVGGVDAYSRRLHKYLKQYRTVIQTASLIHREGFKNPGRGHCSSKVEKMVLGGRIFQKNSIIFFESNYVIRV